MKTLAAFIALILVVYTSHAAAECRGADGNDNGHIQCTSDATSAAGPSLPAAATAKVKELHASMRYFMAIGFHRKSAEKRDAIVTIYREHGVPVPAEYRD